MLLLNIQIAGDCPRVALVFRLLSVIITTMAIEITPERVLHALEDVKDPDLGTSIVQMGMIKDLKIDGAKLAFTCELTTPACPVKEMIEKDIRAKIAERE